MAIPLIDELSRARALWRGYKDQRGSARRSVLGNVLFTLLMLAGVAFWGAIARETWRATGASWFFWVCLVLVVAALKMANTGRRDLVDAFRDWREARLGMSMHGHGAPVKNGGLLKLVLAAVAGVFGFLAKQDTALVQQWKSRASVMGHAAAAQARAKGWIS